MLKPPRYIDVNLLQERLEQVSREPDYMHEGETWDVGVSLAGTIADHIPTADVREERYGKWIDSDPVEWECSECHYEVERWNNTLFCPGCGAKMIKE